MPYLTRMATPPLPCECEPSFRPVVLGEGTTFHPLYSGTSWMIFFVLLSSITVKLHSWMTAISMFILSSLLKSLTSLVFRPATFCCRIFNELAAVFAFLLLVRALFRLVFLVVKSVVGFCLRRLLLGVGAAGAVSDRGFVGGASLLLLPVGAWAEASRRRLAPARALVSII